MAKSSTESTAVNQLIELVQTQKPLVPDPSDDLMFKAPTRPTHKVSAPRMSTAPALHSSGEVPPLPRTRAPLGTQQTQVPPPLPAVRVSTAPPSRAMSIPPLPPARPSQRIPAEAEVTNPGLSIASQQAFVARATRPSAPSPRPSLSSTSSFEYPVAPADSAAITQPAFAASEASDMTGHAPWFEPTPPHARVEQADLLTQMVKRPVSYAQVARKMALPMLALVVVGMVIGGYVALDRAGDSPRAPRPAEGATIAMPVTAPAPVAAVVPAAPVAAVVPAPPVEPAAAPALVDVSIASRPDGATVVLVDRGKTTFLGTTPVQASLDPSRTYELVFTAARRATTVEAIDPAKTSRVDVALPRELSRRARKAAKPATPALPALPAKPALIEPAFDTAAPAVAARPAGEGVLMISSKPPCEIVIDGKPTGLTTPQRAIKLPAGAHRVTLVNTGAGIEQTVAVKIKAARATKLIRDFMP